MLNDDIDRIIYTQKEIDLKVQSLADRIEKSYLKNCGEDLLRERPPVGVGILRGAAVLMSDLTRYMNIPIEYDFLESSSYRGSTERPGEVLITKDVRTSIKERDVLIIEDIIDTGETIDCLIDHMKKRNPRSIKVCSLVSKVVRRKVEVQLDFSGFELNKDLFIVGYGMDYDGKYRNLPYVGVLKKELRPS